MLKNILAVIIFIFSNYCLANSNCEIKPILKNYKSPKVIDNPIRSVISKNENESIVIDIPKPNEIRPPLSLFIYSSKPLKAISFSILSSEIRGYKQKDLKLKAFGIAPVSPDESAITDYRKGWINCDNLPIEVSLPSKEYNAYLLSYPDIKNQYDLFVIPKSKKNDAVYAMQFTSFSEREIKNILGTLRIIGDK